MLELFRKMENSEMDNVFQNPEMKSLEQVQLTVSNKGIITTVPALSKHFVEKRHFLHYTPPQFFTPDGNEIIGAREQWIEIITYIIDDLIWLRGLPFHKFWSNIVYNPKIKKSLAIFLQEAPTHYNLDSLPEDKEVKELMNKLFQNVLVIFARLVTNTGSPTEFMSKEYFGKLLYDNFIFTIPIMLDICQQYGRENRRVVSKILESLFSIQPFYLTDVQTTVPYITQIFQSIEQRFEDCPTFLVGEAVKLDERGGASVEISDSVLKDLIFYTLDTVTTVSIFLENYPPAITFFQNNEFIMKMVSVYSNAIPEMYKRLLIPPSEETTEEVKKLKHLLDVTRVEVIQLFRAILYKDVGDVLESNHPVPEEEVKSRVDHFLELVFNALTESEFMLDYLLHYPIDVDIDILTHICPTIDPVKVDYINKILSPQSASNSFEENHTSESNNSNSNHIAENHNVLIPEEHLIAVSEIKDILCELDEGFIMKCLKYYNYNSASVINAVLENTLPAELTNPSSSTFNSEQASTSTAQPTVIESNGNLDEICEQVANMITVAEVEEGRKDLEYDKLNKMMRDKSHVQKNREIYQRYNLVVDDYDDEYDDTYDDHDIGSEVQDDVIETDRPFTTPRVLLKNKSHNSKVIDEEDDSDNTTDDTRNNSDQFVQDPAIIRAKAEERFASRGRRGRGGGGRGGAGPSQERDVTGKPKGQGQDKSVLSNRNFKNTHKSSQGNHNRRAGSSWKKRQGMVPS